MAKNEIEEKKSITENNRVGVLPRKICALMAKIVKWVSQHKKWLFGGIGTAILIFILTKVTTCDKGAKVNTGPITVQGGGNVEIVGGNKTGLDGKDVAAIVEKIIAQNMREKEGLFQEIGNLKEQLTSAIQRAEEAEA
jgi:hypothetical protein